MLTAGGFSFVFGCFIGSFLKSDLILPLLIIFSVITITFIFFRKKLKLILTSSLFFTLSLLCLFIHESINHIEPDALSEECVHTGVIEEVSRSGFSKNYTVKITEGNLKDKKVLLNGYVFLDAEEGDKISFDTKLNLFEDDFGFNERSKKASEGIFIIGSTSSADEVINLGKSENSNFIHFIRDNISLSLYKALPDYAANLSSAMLLGDKSLLSDTVSEGFRLSGGSHFLAVSGLHLSILTSFLSSLLYKLRIRHKFADVILILFVILYMFVAGFRFSVIRSAIMTILVIFARLLGRVENSLISLSFAGMLICIFNPYAASDIGFILSFAATFGIVISTPYINKIDEMKMNKFFKNLLQNISVSLSACIFAVPISMCYFGYTSFLTVLTSLVLSLPVTIMLSFAFITALIGLISPIVAAMPGILVTLSAKFILFYISVIPKDFYMFTGEASFFVFAAIALMLLCFVKKPSKSTIILFASIFTLLTVSSALIVNLLKKPCIVAKKFGFDMIVEIHDYNKKVILTDSKDRYLSLYGEENDLYDLSEELTIECENHIIIIKDGYAEIYRDNMKTVFDSEDNYIDDCDVYISQNLKGAKNSSLNIIITSSDYEEVKDELSKGNYIFTDNISLSFENRTIKFN